MVDPVSLGLTGIGLVGSLFGQGPSMTDEQRQAYNLMLERSRGLSPELLEMIRRRLRMSIGNEASATSASTTQRLERQNVPIARQQEIMNKLRQQRLGSVESAMLGVEQLNEDVKSNALQQLSGFTSHHRRYNVENPVIHLNYHQ